MDLMYPHAWYERFDRPSEQSDEIKKALEFYAFKDLLATARHGLSLDIGTATGRYLLAALRSGFDAMGIDYNDNAVDSTRMKLVQANFECDRVLKMDARQLEFTNHSLSLVTCMMATIAHTRDYRLILSEVSRVLQPDGCFIFSVWQKSSPIFGNFLSVNSPTENMHLMEICSELQPIKDTLRSSGLRVIHQIEIINFELKRYAQQNFMDAGDLTAEWVRLDRDQGNPNRLSAGEMVVYCCVAN